MKLFFVFLVHTVARADLADISFPFTFANGGTVTIAGTNYQNEVFESMIKDNQPAWFDNGRETDLAQFDGLGALRSTSGLYWSSGTAQEFVDAATWTYSVSTRGTTLVKSGIRFVFKPGLRLQKFKENSKF